MGKKEKRSESRGGFGAVIVQDLREGGAEELQALVEYMGAHGSLPQSDDVWLGDGEVLRLSSVLSSLLASREEKKRAMILLAHSCNPRASAELARHTGTVEASLRGFAALALEESLQWAGPAAVPTKLA